MIKAIIKPSITKVYRTGWREKWGGGGGGDGEGGRRKTGQSIRAGIHEWTDRIDRQTGKQAHKKRQSLKQPRPYEQTHN